MHKIRCEQDKLPPDRREKHRHFFSILFRSNRDLLLRYQWATEIFMRCYIISVLYRMSSRNPSDKDTKILKYKNKIAGALFDPVSWKFRAKTSSQLHLEFTSRIPRYCYIRGHYTYAGTSSNPCNIIAYAVSRGWRVKEKSSRSYRDLPGTGAKFLINPIN